MDYVAFVLDMSGSMLGISEATVAGTINYVEELAKTNPDTRFSLTIFDDVQEKWVIDEPVGKVSIRKVMESYRPRGVTALYDAMGETIERLRKSTKEKVSPGEKLQNRVTVVVMTDGHENASQKHNRGSVSALVKKLTKKGTWTFVYLGANVDAWKEANAIGISAGNTMSYSSSPGSTRSAMSSVAYATTQRLNKATGQSVSFFDDADVDQDQRDEHEKATTPTM